MEARSVTWLHRGGAEMASYRLRAQIPSAYCNDESRINATGADISVFAKPHPDDLEVLRQINARGAKTVVDICDDHFNHPQLGELYETMAREAHAVVCGHNPVIPGIVAKFIGKKNFKELDHGLMPGEAFILHHRDGEIIAIDWMPAPEA